MKDMLVATLGKTRMTECTCCSSRRWLESTVDQWEADRSEQPSFPLLWIGRTVLYKQQAPGPVLQRAPRGDEQPLAMQGQQGCGPLEPNAQASAAGGSDETGNDGAPEVDCRRVEGSHSRTQGGHRGQRPLETHAEDQLPEPPGAPREGHRARRGLPRQGDEGHPPQVDQGGRQHAGEHPDDHWTVEGMRIPRNPTGLWSLGSGGNHSVNELSPGPGALRALVAGRTGSQGSEGEDPRRGRGRELLQREPPPATQLNELVGRRVSDDTGEDEDRQGLREEHQTPERGLEDRRGDGIPTGSRRLGGDQGTGDEVGSFERQSPQQRALSAERGPIGDGKGKQKHCVCCCGSVNEDDVITEKDYARGYVNRATNYATHNEHHDHLGEARQNLEAADRYAKYGEGDFDWGDYSFENCEKFLRETHGVGTKLNLRSIHDPDPEHGGDQAYITYGMFTHGGVTGLTKVTKEAEPIVRYLNGFAKAHLKDDAAWTSFSVTKNIGTNVHRDSNNLRGSANYCFTTGQQEGGHLWLEAEDVSEDQANGGEYVWKRDRQGTWLPGRIHPTANTFFDFDPFLKHSSCDWTGERWCIIYHSVRGYAHSGPEMKKYLRQCGFPTPRLGHTKGGGVVVRPKTTKSTRKTVMNTAGKIGVLMTTLMAAASSFLLEHQGPPVEHDPIVMMEIGGLEGTIEATDLDKAVIEPIEWNDYLDPETRTNAYHIVTGISPKELRVHLEGMPDSVREDVKELIGYQIAGGGEVVLRQGDPSHLINDFVDYVKYQTPAGQDAWVVLGKPKKDAKLLPGDSRPHEVCAVEACADEDIKEIKYDGSGITFADDVPNYMKSSLRRLHQNLGHPRPEDLCRHLRLAGCEPQVVKAAKGMRCATCDATKGAGIARPSTLPRLLDFNSCVGVDIMYCHDYQDKRHAFLTMTDWGTSYHVVARLESESAADVEKAFNNYWLGPFGPPTSVSIDLDGKVQAGMARLCDWHGMKVKNVAAQGKWQGGITERQIKWFKGIWDRVVHELSIDESEVEIAATLVCAAKNDLRRRCGHAPTQWVFGRSPRIPEELCDPDSGEAVTWDVTKDAKFQRLAAIRASARVAFTKLKETTDYDEPSCKGPVPRNETLMSGSRFTSGTNPRTGGDPSGTGQQWWSENRAPATGSPGMDAAGLLQLNTYVLQDQRRSVSTCP